MYDYGIVAPEHLSVKKYGDNQLSSSVIVQGTSAPVSIVHHQPSSPSSPSDIPIIHCVDNNNKPNANAFTKLWSKFRNKISKNDPNESEVLSERMLPEKTNTANIVKMAPAKDFTTNLGAVVEQHQYRQYSKQRPVPSHVQDSSFHLLNTLQPHNHHLHHTHQTGDKSHPTIDNNCNTTPADWSKTLPARRKNARELRARDRPVSLEFGQSSEERSSPLTTYLSTSCNFKTPDEVKLRKSRNRVKTPRHPPLSRIGGMNSMR